MSLYKKFKLTIFIILVTAIFFNLTTISYCADTSITVKKELIKSFNGGKIYKVVSANNTKSTVVVYNNGKQEKYNDEKHSSLLKNEKVSKNLAKTLDNATDSTLIPVSIWVNDIDNQGIDNLVKENLKISDINNISGDKKQSYIEAKRDASKTIYSDRLVSFKKSSMQDSVTIFSSTYTPMIIAYVPKKVIAKLRDNTSISSIDFYKPSIKSDDSTNSVPNINANYTRDTKNLKGSGVKIGIVESGYCDKTKSDLSTRNITFDVSDTDAKKRLSTHATIVTSIIVGSANGLVPNATVYEVGALNRTQDYQKIEWLLDKGVNVINYSAGYTDVTGTYSDMAKWVDHISFQHNIYFVKSAGNITSSNTGISDPGMAYNCITVGSMNDNNSRTEPTWSDDKLSTFSCYSETSGAYKPDLTAPGESIFVPSYTTSNSGTSFSAPLVTGVIAQMVNKTSSLSAQNNTLKSILAAGTTHRTATDYGTYLLSKYYSNKEGAGVIDALGAFNIINGSKYEIKTLSKTQFPYTKTFSVTSKTTPVRVAVSWNKQITISSPHVSGSITEKPLSDIDLEVYDQSNKLVAKSESANNNVELVQFTPSVTGTYKIKVVGFNLSNQNEYLSIAWNQ
jgi:serine protease AprX